MARMFKRHRRRSAKPKDRGERKVEQPQFDPKQKDVKHSYTSVKLRLNSVIKEGPPGTHLPKEVFQDVIERSVVYSSKMFVYGCEFLQQCLIEWSTNIRSMELYGSIGTMLNDTKFYSQCLDAHYDRPKCGPREQTYPLVAAIRRQFYPGGHESATFEFLEGGTGGLATNIREYKRDELKTITLNHFSLNYVSYQVYTIKGFLRTTYGEAKSKDVHRILWKINGEVGMEGYNNELDGSQEVFVEDHREAMGFPSLEAERDGEIVQPEDYYHPDNIDSQDIRDWVENNLDQVVPYYFWMVSYTENNPLAKKAKMCPSSPIGMKHMVMDTTTLGHMLSNCGILRSFKDIKPKAARLHYWSGFFDFKQFEVNNLETMKQFHFFIRTDGRSATLVYDAYKKTTDSIVPRDLEDFREWYNDAGTNRNSK